MNFEELKAELEKEGIRVQNPDVHWVMMKCYIAGMERAFGQYHDELEDFAKKEEFESLKKKLAS